MSIIPPAQAAEAAAPSPFGALIAAVAERLAVADQVAEFKWEHHLEIDDPARERVVIDSARQEGEETGLDGPTVAAFFADQIEANKVIQKRLIAHWRRTAHPAAGDRVDLNQDIRPHLDRLQLTLLAALAHSAAERAQERCALEVARASGAYVQNHQLDELHAIALDVALAHVCAKP